MLPLIRFLVACEMVLLPAWVSAVVLRPGEGPLSRLARAPALAVLGAGAMLVLAAAGADAGAAAVLRAQAVAVGFAVLLAGLAAMIERLAGPRAAQALTTLLGWAVLAAVILAGPVLDLVPGPVKPAVVEAVTHANPLVVAERELGLAWMHQGLTYRLTPIGESYSYLLKDLAWWKTLLAHVFVGSGLLVFGAGRRRGQA